MLTRCPVCDRSFDIACSDAPPFCSARCRLIDLGRWLGEANGIPLQPRGPAEIDDEEESEVAEGWDREA